MATPKFGGQPVIGGEPIQKPGPQFGGAPVNPAAVEAAPMPEPIGLREDLMQNVVKPAKDWLMGADTEDYPELSTTGDITPEQQETFGRSMVPQAEFQAADTPIGMMNAANIERETTSQMTGKPLPKLVDISEDKHGIPLAVDENGRKFYFNRPGPSGADIDYLQEGAKNLAPAIVGGAEVAGLKPLLASAKTGVGTALSEFTGQARSKAAGSGEDFKPYDTAIAGVFGLGGDLAGRVAVPWVAKSVSNVWRKFFGKSDDIGKYFDGEKFTDEGIQFLKDAEVNPEMMTKSLAKEMKKAGAMNADEVKRYNYFIDNEMKPTKAQVSQTVDDFTEQQQALRMPYGTELRHQIENQNAQMINKAQGLKGTTGGTTTLRPETSTELAGYVEARALADDKAISSMYKTVRENVSDAKAIRPQNLYNWIKKNAYQDKRSQGALTEIMGELKARGLVDNKGRLTGRMSADVAEEVRKGLNTLYRTGDQNQKRLALEMKDQLDDDVFKHLGEDQYKAARQLKRDFHAKYSDFKTHKLQERGHNVLKQMYDGTISPDKAFDRIMKGPIEDITKVKAFLLEGGDEGLSVWNNMRAQVMEDAINAATKGGKDQLGNPNWSATIFKNHIEAMRKNGKMHELFDQEEISGILNVMKLGRMRDPITGTQQGFGPSAPAIEKAGDLLANILRKTKGPAAGVAADVTQKGVETAKNLRTGAARRAAANEAVDPARATATVLQNEAKFESKRKANEALRKKLAPFGGLSGIGASETLGGQ